MMVVGRNGFNAYLLLGCALGLALVSGCRTAEGKRERALSTFRVFLEADRGTSGAPQPVQVFRGDPSVTVNIEPAPFLNEGNVSEARIVEALGGFALKVRLDRRGTWLLEQCTVANHGKHLVIFTQFPNPVAPKASVSRWLAAPLISNRISDGVLLFTPDANREESTQIVVGLNNCARKNGNLPGEQP